MSGHSKWHNIRLRKGKQDAERGKIFTKLAKEVIIAARDGGGNPDINLKLRLAIQKAKANSMPADNIKRAIQRGTGEIDGVLFEEVIYEGYGPGGVAVMTQCLTDNRNRTVAEIRHAFAKLGGNMSESGSVAWQFHAKGMILIEKDKVDEDTVMNVALEAGAEDVRTEEEYHQIITGFEEFGEVRQKIEDAGLPMESAELTMIPQNLVLLDAHEANKMIRLMDALEDLDDVQNVYANFDIPDDIFQDAIR
ncbi:MAG: YebC/PmpR family DNA-binding transcriptional regulator [bacterium]|jgi:YebC/PmpR family DNA-binding regulatory protein